MANDTCPTCGHTPVGIHRSEPAERFYEAFKVMPSGCWEWQRARNGNRKNDGYGVFTAAPRTVILAHRYSFALHNGFLDNEMVVRHDCDNPPCVNPAHLRLGTVWENNRDKMLRGRGGYIPRPQKLDAETVEIIRRLSDEGVIYKVLADTFQVSTTTISQIVNRQTWKHVA